MLFIDWWAGHSALQATAKQEEQRNQTSNINSKGVACTATHQAGGRSKKTDANFEITIANKQAN